MKCNVFAGLLFAAALSFVSPNANAQEVAAPAPAQPAPQVQTTNICDECEGGVVVDGFGLRGRAAGLAAGFDVRGRVAGMRAGVAERSDRFRNRVQNRLYVRDVVAPSPYAVPSGELQDWDRFKHYPYGYYQHNFRDASGQPASMGLQMFNPAWQNYYPTPRRFHEGKHFILDVF